jgi:hypothetical protein
MGCNEPDVTTVDKRIRHLCERLRVTPRVRPKHVVEQAGGMGVGAHDARAHSTVGGAQRHNLRTNGQTISHENGQQPGTSS